MKYGWLSNLEVSDKFLLHLTNTTFFIQQISLTLLLAYPLHKIQFWTRVKNVLLLHSLLGLLNVFVMLSEAAAPFLVTNISRIPLARVVLMFCTCRHTLGHV